MSSDLECPSCQCVFTAPLSLTGCAHHLCQDCVRQWAQHSRKIAEATLESSISLLGLSDLDVGALLNRGVRPLATDRCAFCQGAETSSEDLIYCDRCEVPVHQGCYHIPTIPPDDVPWYCEPCEDVIKAESKPKKGKKAAAAAALHAAPFASAAAASPSASPSKAVRARKGKDGAFSSYSSAVPALASRLTCCVCPNRTDCAMKRVQKGGYVHLSCATFLAGPDFLDEYTATPVTHIESIHKMWFAQKCTFCGEKGATVQCQFAKCLRSYHVPCGLQNGALFSVKDLDEEGVYKDSVCPQHRRHIRDVANRHDKKLAAEQAKAKRYKKRSKGRADHVDMPCPVCRKVTCVDLALSDLGLASASELSERADAHRAANPEEDEDLAALIARFPASRAHDGDSSSDDDEPMKGGDVSAAHPAASARRTLTTGTPKRQVQPAVTSTSTTPATAPSTPRRPPMDRSAPPSAASSRTPRASPAASPRAPAPVPAAVARSSSRPSPRPSPRAVAATAAAAIVAPVASPSAASVARASSSSKKKQKTSKPEPEPEDEEDFFACHDCATMVARGEHASKCWCDCHEIISDAPPLVPITKVEAVVEPPHAVARKLIPSSRSPLRSKAPTLATAYIPHHPKISMSPVRKVAPPHIASPARKAASPVRKAAPAPSVVASAPDVAILDLISPSSPKIPQLPIAAPSTLARAAKHQAQVRQYTAMLRPEFADLPPLVAATAAPVPIAPLLSSISTEVAASAITTAPTSTAAAPLAAHFMELDEEGDEDDESMAPRTPSPAATPPPTAMPIHLLRSQSEPAQTHSSPLRSAAHANPHHSAAVRSTPASASGRKHARASSPPSVPEPGDAPYSAKAAWAHAMLDLEVDGLEIVDCKAPPAKRAKTSSVTTSSHQRASHTTTATGAFPASLVAQMQADEDALMAIFDNHSAAPLTTSRPSSSFEESKSAPHESEIAATEDGSEEATAATRAAARDQEVLMRLESFADFFSQLVASANPSAVGTASSASPPELPSKLRNQLHGLRATLRGVQSLARSGRSDELLVPRVLESLGQSLPTVLAAYLPASASHGTTARTSKRNKGAAALTIDGLLANTIDPALAGHQLHSPALQPRKNQWASRLSPSATHHLLQQAAKQPAAPTPDTAVPPQTLPLASPSFDDGATNSTQTSLSPRF